MSSHNGFAVEQVSVESIADLLPGIREMTGEARRFDLGVFPLGFEDRVTGVAERLATSGSTLGRAIVLDYTTNPLENEARWEELLSVVSSLADSDVERVAEDDFSRGGLEQLLSGGGIESVLLDITVASNPLILRLLGSCLNADVRLTVAYSEAETYYPEESEYRESAQAGLLEDLELASGTGRLESAVEWPGELDDMSRDCVIIIPGFDRDRARKVINYVDPALLISGDSQVTWIVGRPHLSEDAWRSELMMAIHEIGEGQKWTDYQVVSTFDFIETWRALERIYFDRSSTSRFTLAPMGSKLSAVGCAVFSISRPDVRVVFASPTEYRADRYSVGIRNVWQLDIDSGVDLSKVASSVGEIQVRDSSGDLLLKGVERVKWPS